MSDLGEIILGLMQRIGELERRQAGSQWRGKVKEVDAKAGTARLIIGQDEDGKDVLSPPLPYGQTAGALKIHSPPAVGQQMEAFAQGGDLEQATLKPLGWSDENKQPSDKSDEDVITRGDSMVRFKGDEIYLKRGDTIIHMKADNTVSIDGPVSFKKPVVFEKGFTAKAGTGGSAAGSFEGTLHATQDITSDTRLAAPTVQGNHIA